MEAMHGWRNITFNFYWKLDLAFNHVKPKDWYFVLDLVQLRTGLGCVKLTNLYWTPLQHSELTGAELLGGRLAQVAVNLAQPAVGLTQQAVNLAQ